MAIRGKDFSNAMSGGNSLAQLILGNHTKKEQQAQQGDIDAENSAAKLTQTAQLEQDAVDANLARANAQATSMGIPQGKYSVTASQSGFGVNPEPAKDPLELYFKKAMLDRAQEEKDDKAVQQLSNRVEKAQLGPSQAALGNLGASIKEKGMALGPISGSSMMPAALVSIGEQIGLAKPGATAQRQSVEALQAFQRNPLFGASLTPGEQQSFNNAFGNLTGGTEEQRRQAIATLEMLHNKATQNVAAGSNPRIVQKYKAQGGISLEPSNALGGGGGMDPAKKARLEALRAKHRGQ